ncbi:MAG: YraN family protein [Kiritimatiellia bacterium]
MENPFRRIAQAIRAPAETAPAETAAQGRWGEERAAALLAGKGWRVIGRNVRPCADDRRREIDLIVRSRDGRTVAFVEVKTHKRRTPRAPRLFGVDRRKKKVLLRACTSWILRHQWHGNFRFDIVEVYGSHRDRQPLAVDHIENVPLFPPRWRFW